MNSNAKGEVVASPNKSNSLNDYSNINVEPSVLLQSASKLMDKFYNEPPPVEYCSYPPINSAEPSFVFGDTNAGKSIYMMDAVIKNAHRVDGNVAYLDLENANHQIANRYPKGTEMPNNLLFMDLDLFELSDYSDITGELIEQMVLGNNVKWLVIDNMTWLSEESLVDTKVAHKLMKSLTRIVKVHKVAITVIAHTVKRDLNQAIQRNHLEGSSKMANFGHVLMGIGTLPDGRSYTRILKARQTHDKAEIRIFEIEDKPYCHPVDVEITDVNKLFSIAGDTRGRKESIDYSKIAKQLFSKSSLMSHAEMTKKLIHDIVVETESNAKRYIGKLIEKDLIVKDNDSERYFLKVTEIDINQPIEEAF